MKTYTVGTLAYLDTIGGLIPCKVINVLPIGPADYGMQCTVKVTANRGAWKKGETVTHAARCVVPRESVFTRFGQYRIRNNFKWSQA